MGAALRFCWAPSCSPIPWNQVVDGRRQISAFHTTGDFFASTMLSTSIRRPTPIASAPLLCAGLIGWRCLLKAGAAKNSASMASALRLTSFRRSLFGEVGRSSLSHVRAIRRPRISRSRLPSPGLAVQRNGLQWCSTQLLSLRRLAR
jgi:hypothetical protein